jgi:hypothetical protein
MLRLYNLYFARKLQENDSPGRDAEFDHSIAKCGDKAGVGAVDG